MNKSELQKRQQEQLLEAYERLSGKTPSEVRKNIYKSLTFYWLYREPPEGFTDPACGLRHTRPAHNHGGRSNWREFGNG